MMNGFTDVEDLTPLPPRWSEAKAPQPDHNVHRGAPTFSGEADHPLGGREESRAGVGLSEDRKTAEVKQGEGSAREHWKAEGPARRSARLCLPALGIGALAIGNERLTARG